MAFQATADAVQWSSSMAGLSTVVDLLTRCHGSQWFTACTQDIWKHYQALAFPFRLLLELTGVTEGLLTVTEGLQVAACSLAHLLAGMPTMPPEMIATALHDYAVRWSLTGQPAHQAVDTIMRLFLDWTPGGGMQQGHYTYKFKAEHAWQRQTRINLTPDDSAARQGLANITHITVTEQTTSCHLTRSLLNQSDRLLVVRVALTASQQDASVDFNKPIVLLGRLYRFMMDKEGAVYLYATHTFCEGDNLGPDGVLLGPHVPYTFSHQDVWGIPVPSVGPPAVPSWGTCLGHFVPLHVQQALKLQAAFNTEPKPGKLSARQELLLTPTIELPCVDSSNVYYTDDIQARGSTPQDKHIMTDGGGLMGLGLCEYKADDPLAVRSGKRVPAEDQKKMHADEYGVKQVRVLDERCWPALLAKGTLTPCNKLPRDSILMPFSMVKLPASPQDYVGSLFVKDPRMSELMGMEVYTVDTAWAAGVRNMALSVEPQLCAAAAAAGIDLRSEPHPVHVLLSNSFFRLVPGKLCKELVKILYDRGAPPDPSKPNMTLELFKKLMQKEVGELHKVGSDVEVTIRLAGLTGKKELADQLRAGFYQDPAVKNTFVCKDGYIETLLNEVIEGRCEQLLRLQLPLDKGDAWRVVGVPDFSGTIPEGCVVLVADGLQHKQAEVLLYRNPGLKPTDLKLVQLIPPPHKFVEFYYGVNSSGSCRLGVQGAALFFSTQGSKSLAEELSGGDFDGDDFLMICVDILVDAVKQRDEYISNAASKANQHQSAIAAPTTVHPATPATYMGVPPQSQHPLSGGALGAAAGMCTPPSTPPSTLKRCRPGYGYDVDYSPEPAVSEPCGKIVRGLRTFSISDIRGQQPGRATDVAAAIMMDAVAAQATPLTCNQLPHSTPAGYQSTTPHVGMQYGGGNVVHNAAGGHTVELQSSMSSGSSVLAAEAGAHVLPLQGGRASSSSTAFTMGAGGCVPALQSGSTSGSSTASTMGGSSSGSTSSTMLYSPQAKCRSNAGCNPGIDIGNVVFSTPPPPWRVAANHERPTTRSAAQLDYCGPHSSPATLSTTQPQQAQHPQQSLQPQHIPQLQQPQWSQRSQQPQPSHNTFTTDEEESMLAVCDTLLHQRVASAAVLHASASMPTGAACQPQLPQSCVHYRTPPKAHTAMSSPVRATQLAAAYSSLPNSMHNVLNATWAQTVPPVPAPAFTFPAAASTLPVPHSPFPLQSTAQMPPPAPSPALGPSPSSAAATALPARKQYDAACYVQATTSSMYQQVPVCSTISQAQHDEQRARLLAPFQVKSEQRVAQLQAGKCQDKDIAEAHMIWQKATDFRQRHRPGQPVPLGTEHPDCVKAAEGHATALDSGKTGIRLCIDDLMKAYGSHRPDYLCNLPKWIKRSMGTAPVLDQHSGPHPVLASMVLAPAPVKLTLDQRYAVDSGLEQIFFEFQQKEAAGTGGADRPSMQARMDSWHGVLKPWGEKIGEIMKLKEDLKRASSGSKSVQQAIRAELSAAMNQVHHPLRSHLMCNRPYTETMYEEYQKQALAMYLARYKNIHQVEESTGQMRGLWIVWAVAGDLLREMKERCVKNKDANKYMAPRRVANMYRMPDWSAVEAEGMWDVAGDDLDGAFDDMFML